MGSQDHPGRLGRFSRRRTAATRAGADRYCDDDKREDPDHDEQTPLPLRPRGRVSPSLPRSLGWRSVHRPTISRAA